MFNKNTRLCTLCIVFLSHVHKHSAHISRSNQVLIITNTKLCGRSCPNYEMIKLTIIFLVIIKNVHLTDLSYYEILGVSKQASTQEIRQAYKKLAVKLHPDKNSNKDEQARFLKITEAYETLKDPEQRHKYDMYGSQTSYTRKFDYKSQTEYNNLFYNGLYHDDPFVETVTGGSFYNFLSEGLHFINFYSPFCPPCQNLVDHWKKLAEVYKGIIKVGAVNCKYHNSFCYNSQRINSYPTLLLYPNGKNGNFVYYRGRHNFEALEEFVMSYISNKVNVPTLWQLRPAEKPMAYVIDADSIDRNALIRIAFRLKGLVSVVTVEDNDMRNKLTDNPDTIVVFKSKGISKEIYSSDENTIVREIMKALPKLEQINRDKLKKIRNELRSGARVPWVLHFTSEDDDKLSLYQIRNAFPNMNFGEINCDEWRELCGSLQVEETPAWAVLKRGGTYQRAHLQEPTAFIRTAAATPNLHTLSPSDLRGILDGDVGVWVLLVVPYQVAWDHIISPLTQASLHYVDDDINFGIMACTANTNQHCRQIAYNQAAILVQNGTTRHPYNGRIDEHSLVDFIQLLMESSSMDLTEQQALEILDVSSREHIWLVAYLPANCGSFCDELTHEWRLVAKRLRPLDFVRVGVLQCRHQSGGICQNVRLPTARLYQIATPQHHSVNLQHLSQAPYILEWTLEHIDDTVKKLSWHTFSKTVVSEELNPSRGKKPWLIYFHSPRCYRCYEMYPDFAIISILLGNSLNFGKVNCISDRSLCQQEHITSYPSIKLYLNNPRRGVNTIALQPKEYTSLLQDIRPHIMRYDNNILSSIDNLVLGNQKMHFQHDEL